MSDIRSTNNGNGANNTTIQARSHPPFLAKIYRLGDNDLAWQDCGVVRVRCGYVERLNDTALILTSEDNPNNVVLETPLSHCECRKDVPTIISWQDTLDLFHPTTMNGTTGGSNSVQEVALSFETPEGCARIWEDICSVQGRIVSDYHYEDYRNGSEGDDTGHGYEASLMSHGSEEGHSSFIAHNIPPLIKANLENIARTFRGVGIAFKARFAHELASISLQGNLEIKFTLPGLLDIYEEVERDYENPAKRKEGLAYLFEIIKFISLLDDKRILEMILSDECFERVAGCLENDPGMPFRPNHRRFLRDEARFNQVVPISNPKVQTMIIQRFRLGFLRDVLLPRVLDELSFKRLNTMDIQLSADIAQMLHQNNEFVAQLFKVLSAPSSPERARAVAFLTELCGLSQKMQVQARNSFYRSLNEEDRLLEVCERVLAEKASTSKERLDATEILILILKHDTTILRDRIINSEASRPSSASSSNEEIGSSEQDNRGGDSLLGLLVDAVVSDEDAGVQAQAQHLLQSLLDPESFVAVQNTKEDDPFIATFYKRYLIRLLAALDNIDLEARKDFKDPEMPVSAAHLVCGLLSSFVQTHGYLVREVIAKHNVMKKVLGLVECPEKHLVLDAIRFVRTCIGMKERFYTDLFIQNDHLRPIFKVFARNGTRNNLINSTVIDILEFIRNENIVPLVEYIVKEFADELRPIGGYVNTFTELERLYQANVSGVPTKSPSTQSLPLSSGGPVSADGKNHIATANMLLSMKPQRVMASRSNIFGESRAFRDDDDESRFEDEAPMEHATSTSPASINAMILDENPSPTKRQRLDVPQAVDEPMPNGLKAPV